jgi:hypothetical protein
MRKQDQEVELPPTASGTMILGTLGAVEMGLVALGIPHGRGGVDAAVQWLGSQVPPDSA